MSQSSEPGYRDADTLRRLYHGEGFTQAEIADQMGCCRKTITNWMQKHEIETNPGERIRRKQLGENNSVWNRETRDCSYCGAEIERPASAFRGERSFCSNDCEAQWRTGNPDVSPPDNTVSDGDLLADLQRLKEELGRPPSTDDVTTYGKHGHPTYRERFGSLPAAREAAGLQRDVPFGTKGVRLYPDDRHPYGDTWRESREQRLEIDDHQCVVCGIGDEKHREKHGVGLTVHHITPAREFADLQTADAMDNLVSLCSVHHRKWEGIPLRPQKA